MSAWRPYVPLLLFGLALLSAAGILLALDTDSLGGRSTVVGLICLGMGCVLGVVGRVIDRPHQRD